MFIITQANERGSQLTSGHILNVNHLTLTLNTAPWSAQGE